ncbi:MnhB domain-containing protein [Halalkalicoccus salilacus]|uniref:MnhB domain-containing protein n=1 Tax=Halalkalicoccus salilacus TaxID=3117459 RepID=UPI00300EE7B3
MTTVIIRTIARLTAPIVVVFAISLFFQGHNLPGGGFIAGVLSAGAFVLLYIAFGLDYLEIGVLGRDVEGGTSIVEHRTVLTYHRTFVLGLAIAVGSGLITLLVDEPLLAQTYTIVEDVPIYHEIELATALVFDLGVFFVVVGGLLTILSVVSGE